MTEHRIGTQEEWQAQRDELLQQEKELTRRGDELACKRRELPWVPVEQDYRFETAAARRPSPICSTAAPSCSSTTSCSGRTGRRAARSAPRSRTRSIPKSPI